MVVDRTKGDSVTLTENPLEALASPHPSGVPAAPASLAGDSSVRGSRCAQTLARLGACLSSAASELSLHEVRAQMQLVRAVTAIADARLIELNQRMTELSTAPAMGCAVDPERELRSHGGLRSRDARALHVQTSAVAAAPAIGDLLALGATTSGHVEALGHALVAAGDGRDTLLGNVRSIAERAVTMGVDDFDRYVKRLARDAQTDDGISRFEHQRRSTHLKLWNDRDGMVRLSGAFDPERGAAIAGCLDQRVEAMFHSGDREQPVEVAPGIDPNDHRRALALHAFCTDRRGGSGVVDAEPGRPLDVRPSRAEVIVHVDIDTLRSGLHATSVCRTSHGADLPPETVRRLACEADIIPIVLNGASLPLDVGRAKRLATVHQRRALEARHTTCAIDGCDTAFSRCTIHHLDPWEHGGVTDLDNLVPLCTRHHHQAHEGGWRLRLDPASRHVHVTLPGDRPDDG